jgi:uncharacterized protein (TIGR02680 family)
MDEMNEMNELQESATVPGGTLELFPAAAPAAVSLPSPGRERFQPLRAGILNLWQYDDQEFRFADGRLILRGENGSGKSKALEVLLPFLFDADLSPHRLDPFGGTSRTMEWNLLQDGRFDQRVGYVWLELGRRRESSEESAPEEIFWTLGCGLRAGQRTRRVDAWYFLTRRRVGRDLALLSPQRAPLLKDQLRQQIGDAGWIFDTGREYREKLDTQIFGLGADRFATLCHLLLQLRRPHLSERLDPATLSEILKESLPPLDADLIAQLSESFERLDNEQKELARVEAAVAGVAGFLEVYRDYGRGVARARAAEVRQTDSRYHKTAAEVREAEEEGGRLAAHLADLTEHAAAADEAAAASRGTLRALEQSDAMRSAEALRAKREHAEALSRRAGQQREDAQREERHREERQRDRDGAAVEAKRAETDRAEAERGALAAARESGLEAIANAAVAALAERVSTAEALVRAAVQRREDAIAELRRLAAERERARRDEERSEDKLRDADARLRQAVARTLDARAKADRERQDLQEALLRWAEGLEELRLDAAELESLGSRLEEEGGLAAALGALVTPRRDALVRQRTTLAEETARTGADRGKAEDERRRVEAARELGPEPPRTRAASREERPGGPLYLLCDVADGLGGEERAGLEAALEAAGLLDAWVLPDGGLLPAGTFDTCLVPASEPVAGSTLADFLRPVPGHGVETATIAAVLGSISVAPAGTEPAGVAPSGAFRLGPLQGAWAKPVAEHLGAGAREEARARRLAEIAALLADFDRRLAELAARGTALKERLERLDLEALALPSSAPLTRAALLAEAAEGDEIRRRTERDQAGTEAAGARAARHAAEQRLLARAREHDLAGWIDDLEGARERLAGFKSSFRELVRSVGAASVAAERSERAHLRLAEAGERVAELQRRAQESSEAARAAAAEHAALEATVGVEVREVEELHKAESRKLEALEQRRKELAEAVQAAREQRARLAERLDLRRQELAERDAERATAVAGLGRALDAGLLLLVLGETFGDTPEPPPAWSLTRALETAREIEKATGDVDLAAEAANRRVNRLHERFRILTNDLGAEYQPNLDQDDSLVRARVGWNGREHDIPGLLATLRENLETRRGLLAEHEREVLRRYLLGEVGDHLRHRLREARALVDEMNKLLEDCRTASGLTLKLAWKPVDDAAPEIRDAVQLLRQDLALLGEAERRRLEAFFQARITEARQQWESVPWREHLMAALDYRRWYRFSIQSRLGGDGMAGTAGTAGEWRELTRRSHGASSGGEKAVALHLPLFAAAAAHYGSAHATAPRIILLDEAFAGIDLRMRGRCMGLLVAFGLDFMMTSHEEWGCHEELPGVATYQLYRDPTLEGVAAVRFVWSGNRLREDPD